VNYDVTHITQYSYATTVEFTNGVLRLTPVTGRGQVLERFRLETDPVALTPTERIDPFGNKVLSLRIEKPHRKLSIAATSQVRVDRDLVNGDSSPWERVADEALADASLSAECPAFALYPSRLVPLSDEATAYGGESFVGERPIHDAATELTRRIRADFAYDPSATKVSTPASEAFRRRRGVCQDFAHIMIAALRGLGLPALYVSGYIRTLPPPGAEQRLIGADASHAWVSLWCGRALGWLDFDPTNAQTIRNDHIVVARGRDYSDASPVESMVLSSGSHRLDVQVNVTPREESPSGELRQFSSSGSVPPNVL
jgi:transglutaminase-like putative cysteine protease